MEQEEKEQFDEKESFTSAQWPTESTVKPPDLSEVPDSVSDKELYEKVRDILNKLTVSNFCTSVKEMTELTIDTEKRLKGVTNIVFEKAINESDFCVEYANMCRFLCQIKVSSATKKGEYVNFRALLLTRCQLQFEKPKDFKAELDEKRKEMKKIEDQEKPKEDPKAEEYLAETKTRLWILGNIRLIGELFKLKMLTEKIVHNCMVKLLRAEDEVSIECACQLMFTIGKEMDTEKAKSRINQSFEKMKKIVTERRASPQVRCMLQYIIDLRLNKWINRQDESNRNIFGLINEDAKRESLRRQISQLAA